MLPHACCEAAGCWRTRLRSTLDRKLRPLAFRRFASRIISGSRRGGMHFPVLMSLRSMFVFPSSSSFSRGQIRSSPRAYVYSPPSGVYASNPLPWGVPGRFPSLGGFGESQYGKTARENLRGLSPRTVFLSLCYYAPPPPLPKEVSKRISDSRAIFGQPSHASLCAVLNISARIERFKAGG